MRSHWRSTPSACVQVDGIDVQVAEYAYFKHLITNSGSDVVRILLIMNKQTNDTENVTEIKRMQQKPKKWNYFKALVW